MTSCEGTVTGFDWVPLDTVPGLISAGEISSATTLAALLYTLVQDGPGRR
jgi:hypothetical protein